MATEYTSILKLALPTTGELDGTWGDVVNNNITSMVEEAVAGLSTINTWTTNSHTLTTANGTTSESRAAILVLTDTGGALTGSGEVICPTASKVYIVKNDTGETVTVKTAAGTGIAVTTGSSRILFCDETNVVEAGPVFNGQFADGSLASPSITFSSDTDTGFYRAGSGTVSYSYNAARRFTFGDTLYVTNTSNGTGIPSSSERYVEMPNNGLFGIKLQNQLTGIFTDSSSSTTYNAGFFALSGATKGTIVVSTGGTAYNTSSDYRLKENVVPIENAVARIDNLNPVRFNFTAAPDVTVDGFLAHEVTPVVPEAITGEKDAVDADGNPVYQGIDQAKLVPLLVAAVQELSARVAELEAS
jgi:hypothetical protein